MGPVLRRAAGPRAGPVLDLVVQHLSDVDERLVGKSIASAEQTWNQALEALQSASCAYDQQTDHGRRQGTVIDATSGAALE